MQEIAPLFLFRFVVVVLPHPPTRLLLFLYLETTDGNDEKEIVLTKPINPFLFSFLFFFLIGSLSQVDDDTVFMPRLKAFISLTSTSVGMATIMFVVVVLALTASFPMATAALPDIGQGLIPSSMSSSSSRSRQWHQQ